MEGVKHPYKKLAAAILLRSIKDLVGSDPVRSLDSLWWILFSQDCQFFVDCLDMQHPITLILTGRVPRQFPRLKAKENLDEFDFLGSE